jgi:hypothetical protein
LVFTAPKKLKDELCTVDLKVADNNPTTPLSIKKTVKILIKA